MSSQENIFRKIFSPFVSLYHFIMGLAGLEFEEEKPQTSPRDGSRDSTTPSADDQAAEQDTEDSGDTPGIDTSGTSRDQTEARHSKEGSPETTSSPDAASHTVPPEESVTREPGKHHNSRQSPDTTAVEHGDSDEVTRKTKDVSSKKPDEREDSSNQLQSGGTHTSPDFHEALTEITPQGDDPFVDSNEEVKENPVNPVNTIEDETSAAETIVAETGDTDWAPYDDTINHLLSEHTKLIESAHEQQDEDEDDDAEARQAQRDVRAAENRARLARLEEEMAAVIAANAARAAKRKNEIDQELQKNAANVARLRAEREELMKKRLEEAEARLAELTTGLKHHEDEARRLTTERKLIIEGLAKAKTMEKESLNQIGSRSTQAVERARALARQQKAQADKRAREIMEQRKKRQDEIRAARQASTASNSMNQKTDAPGSHDSAGQRARMVANARAQQERQRSEQLRKQREAQQIRIKAAAQEKARREAARAAQIEQERQARLAAVKAKAKAEEEARRQALRRRKESNEQK